MNLKVSVIIPVYNAEKYIAACIESLLGQTLQACEFIFINDGSVDNSRQIIESYQKKDTRIKLENQENQGVGSARNRGLHLAAGEYVGFVDADDYVKEGMYEQLYNAAKRNDLDVMICDFESEMEGRRFITQYPFTAGCMLTKDQIELEILPYFLKADNLNTVCNKLYKNSLIKEMNIVFPEKVALGEDGMFNIKFFSYADTAAYCKYTGYHYREVAGSATRNMHQKDYFQRAIEVYQMDWPVFPKPRIEESKLKQLKASKLVQSVMSYIHIYFKPSKEMSFLKRYHYVSNMICNKWVQDSLEYYYEEHKHHIGNYEDFLLQMIKRKSAFGLYCATAYSRWRNS